MTGHISWYTLEKKNKSKRRGLIKLKLAFNSEHNAQVSFQEHRHLLRMLLLNELETQKIDKYTWIGKFPAAGEVIVLQHGVQRGLHKHQITLARWIEFATIHQEHPLSFALFQQLISDLVAPMKSGDLGEEETKLFWEAAKKVLHSGLNMLRKMRRPTNDKENAMRQLIAILR